MKFLLQNKNKKKNILSIYSILTLILITIINLPYTLNSTLEEVREAIKEVAYSFYMRGQYIQYSDSKFRVFHPEDATHQKRYFLVCWTLIQAIYTELLNITVPCGDIPNFLYSTSHLGSPEVIVYNKKNSENGWYFYDPTKDNNTRIVYNPNLKRDIIPILQTGDIISFSGHTFIIYDIEKDINGNPTDAILMETSPSNYIISKLCRSLKLSGGTTFGDSYDFLFYDINNNTDFKTGIEQGGLALHRITTIPVMFNIDYPISEYRTEEYCILRFIQKDSKGNAILKYKNFYEYDKTLPNEISFNELIELPKRHVDRIKFHHIYIEKTLNKHNGCFVDIGEMLVYKILIKNGGDKDYKDDIIVTENLSKYVTFEAHYEINKPVAFKYNIIEKKLIWNIGKLKKGEKIDIYYYVKVTSGKPGDIIENSGFVGNIPSSKVENTIGTNLDKKKKDLIKKKFEKLKKQYNGKKLINEIYKQLFDINIKLDEFDLKELIIHKEGLPSEQFISLNKTNIFYGAILNKYWNCLKTLKSSFIEGGEEFDFSKLFPYQDYYKIEKRQDFIYSGDFRTGDILIYINNYDATYELDKDKKVVKKDITYESGEYAYIYIEGKGFVGVNKGNNNNIKDDRNEFNAKYYEDNKLELLYQRTKTNVSNDFLEMANLQTLLAKDYYVILRPSVIFDFKYNNNSLAKVIFIVILLILIISIISLIIIKKIRYNPEINMIRNLLTKPMIN